MGISVGMKMRDCCLPPAPLALWYKHLMEGSRRTTASLDINHVKHVSLMNRLGCRRWLLQP